MARKKMTEEEKQSWENLYYYVKNLLGYDENQALSNAMVLRLKGLLTNKFMENKNVASTANYSYETILNAFKYSSMDIQRALTVNRFTDEMHRFNYILKIVERNINTVYMKTKGVKKSEEKIDDVDTTIANYTGVKYQVKQDIKNREDKFSDLW
jgi:hypothetical protein